MTYTFVSEVSLHSWLLWPTVRHLGVKITANYRKLRGPFLLDESRFLLRVVRQSAPRPTPRCPPLLPRASVCAAPCVHKVQVCAVPQVSDKGRRYDMMTGDRVYHITASTPAYHCT